MRGSLAAADNFRDAIEKIADERMRGEKIYIPEKTPSSHLAWNFNGTIKFLTECNRDELLYVCEVLCKKLESSTGLPNINPLPSAA